MEVGEPFVLLSILQRYPKQAFNAYPKFGKFFMERIFDMLSGTLHN